MNVGGIVGSASRTDKKIFGNIVHCINKGTVQGTYNVGGIIGTVTNQNEYEYCIMNTSNLGNVYGTDYVGGIVGTNSSESTTILLSKGIQGNNKIEGATVGSILGYDASGSSTRIEACEYYGSLDVNNNSNLKGDTKGQFVGKVETYENDGDLEEVRLYGCFYEPGDLSLVGDGTYTSNTSGYTINEVGASVGAVGPEENATVGYYDLGSSGDDDSSGDDSSGSSGDTTIIVKPEEDKTAPTFKNIYVKTQGTNVTVGDVIEIGFTANEAITGVLDVTLTFGSGTNIERTALFGGTNGSTLVYYYIVKKGDNGKLSITYEGTIFDISTNRNKKDISGDKNTDIIADTTAPTVAITADKSNPTNEKLITYTFKFSESVNGFTKEDITVNNGNKGELAVVKEGLEYTLKVEPTITDGNEGTLQVIVEEGVCQDLVAQNNIRQESNIIIDKTRPTVTDYEITQKSGKVIINTTFSEAIADVSKLGVTLNIGGKAARGEFEAAEIYENNKVKFVYNVDGTDGGKVEATLKGTVKDVAGNDSEKINLSLENNITLKQTVVKSGTTTYSFKKGNKSITDFTNPTYFVKGEVITVTKVTVTEEEGGTVKETTSTYTHKVVEDLDLSHMKYMKVVTKTEDKNNNGTIEENEKTNGLEFYTTNQSGSIDISEANIYFDTVLPKVTTEIVANNVNALGVHAEGEEFTIKATTSEAIKEGYIAPEIAIKFGTNASKFNNGIAQYVETLTNENGTTTWVYRYVATEGDEGKISLAYTKGSVKDLAGNSTTLINLNAESNTFKLNEITVDATAPTVVITAKSVKNNITNLNSLEYTFTWSEEVNGFTADDITVNNGTKGELVQSQTNKKVYTMTVNTNVENGNEGNIQVIVEQNACQDKVGLSNVRTENVIRVDKISPILISLEAYGESNIKLNNEVAPVKEYYKSGDIVKVVATFSENIETSTAPELVLEFSESGNAKGNVSVAAKSGNKITYTYTITNEDKGTLSVKGYSGTVIDVAGNQTVVTKRKLDGDTIIADIVAPELVGITAIAPNFEYDALLQDGETKRYGLTSSEITIIAEYSENVYHIGSNLINKINNTTLAPVLNLKFGNGTTRTAHFSKTEGNKVYYTYNIQSGDNGNLSIVSLKGTVCDIAGNTVTTNTNLPILAKYEEEISEENKVDVITADTTKANITFETSAINYDDNKNVITGNGSYYRKGSVITITATTNEYVYNGSIERFTTSNAPEVDVSFANSGNAKGEVECIKVEYVDNKTIFTYTYEIKENENGTLKLNFAENQGFDIAINGNNVKESTISSIIADTVNPVTNWQSWVESEGYGIVDNGNGTWVVTFSEKLYVYNASTFNVGSSVGASSAPKLLVSNDNVTALETTISKVETVNGKTVITYTYSPYTKNIGIYGMKFANVSDKAGNLFNAKDQVAPTLSNIKVTSPETGKYKAGEVITIVATFDEKIAGTAPVLTLKFGDLDAKGTVSAGIIDDRTITYTYTITTGDNGILSIKSFAGTGLKDLSDNHWTAPETVTLSSDSNRITADTILPTIIKVEAKVSEEVIGKYIVETNEYVVGRTNADTVNYVITFSEEVNLLNEDAIKLINAEKGKVTVSGNTITIEANTITESVQSLIVPANVVEDKVGNICENYIRFNAITVDFTKPTVRFISEYNGGKYVLPTNIGKVEIRPNVEINEDISKIEYKWDEGEYVEIENYSSSSDIAVPVKTFTEYGQYKLFIKVIDLAGNVTETSKTYEILYSDIEISVDKTEYTNQDVTATVSFGEGLTDNRKVTFKAEDSNEKVELNAIGTNENGTQYNITTNGTLYVEVTDKIGNKVFTEYTIYNIDKVAPEINIELNGANLVIGTGENKATIKTNVETNDNEWVEDAKYVFLQEDIDVMNITSEQKEKIANSLDREVQIQASSTKDSTPYYLYVLAKDKAGNETIVKSNPFIVEDTNERKVTTTVEGENGPEEKEEIIPAERPVDTLIRFEQIEEDIKDKAYVSISYDYQVIKDSSATLEDEAYGYITDSVAEIYGNTKIKVEAWDACGNRVYNEYSVTDIKGPDFSINGNPEVWTNNDVELELYSNTQLKALTLNGHNILGNNKYEVKILITEYGYYTFEATDIYNNTSEQTIEVKIDKSAPEITDVKIEDGKVVITANDMDKTFNKELSGVAEYAITGTTEVPVEWSKSNVINVTKDANFFVWAKDNAGNIITKEEIVVRDITAPELTITTDVQLDKWTTTDIKVDVKANEELNSLVIKYKEMEEQEGQTVEVEREVDILNTKVYTITSNGTYEIIATDKSGNITKETIEVSKIDKISPEISNAVANGKDVTITANDGEGSGVAEYAVTTTTEVPTEWSKSNVIKVTEDGTFYVWAKDNSGNVTMKPETVVVDTTAPTVLFNYLSQTITVGMPLEAYILTNEEATILYSWDNENWVNSENYETAVKVSKKSTTPGTYTLFAKAIDKAGNESVTQELEFTVSNVEEIKQPDIIFEDLPTIQINGVRYVKVSADMTSKLLTDKMNGEALCGKTPEYTKLTEDGKLKTGSEIAINKSTKYVVVVNGDVDCDGKVSFLGDVVMANNCRIGQIKLTTVQQLAADINNSGKIEFISDIVAINNYRLGIIKSL